MDLWRQHWTVARWREFLDAGETDAGLEAIRQCTHTGRPLGSSEFVKSLEQSTRRQLAPRKGGRPGRPGNDHAQELFDFES
jgi:hypothetical protein